VVREDDGSGKEVRDRAFSRVGVGAPRKYPHEPSQQADDGDPSPSPGASADQGAKNNLGKFPEHCILATFLGGEPIILKTRK
jgi:hypothetical protein